MREELDPMNDAGELKDLVGKFDEMIRLGKMYFFDVEEFEDIIDFYFEKNPIETLYKSLNSADAIGLNVYTPTYKDTAYIAKIIKESNPDLPIIIGGPHCTLQLDRSLLNIPDADIAVIGEGEQIIKDIIKFLEGKKQLSEILGIYYQDNSRKNKAIFYFSLIIFLICL